MPRFTLLPCVLSLWTLLAPSLVSAEGVAGQLQEPPAYGLYYDRYEPSFYTGFAPRTREVERFHLHLGRGNQIRVTVVLSDDVMRDYARDLIERERTYRKLIDDGQVVLTQNRSFEDFERTLAEEGVASLAAQEGSLSPEALRQRNLALLERLNPGRVFRIDMPVDEVMARWAAQLQPADRNHMDNERQLELINLLLPTRLFVAELDRTTSEQLTALVRGLPPGGDTTALAAVRPQFLQLVERASHGIYPVRDGAFRFDEFTAIYPVGTLNAFTTYHGRQIPEYPTPGRRALTTHQRTGTADHIPIDDIYSYSPWLPYMHVGPRLHNAIHTLWWQMTTTDTSFLPASWRTIDRGNRDGQPFDHLWLLSRGPMSHGCTHLNAGHIAELRQMLPTDVEDMYRVDFFLNTSYRYDVFDIDGDFSPEVMGVRYFIAYSLKDNRPDRLRVTDERYAYYDWLYGGELAYEAGGRGVFREARDNHFIGREAEEGAEYAQIPLYEADYAPEHIQFYRFVGISFARELRKVGVTHPFVAPPPEPRVVSAHGTTPMDVR